jgi:Tol biopolymer transport system component/DNA-binding winged helix-turn-helix (wHTH) protein
MGRPATNPRAVRFGLFELDLEARELRKSGVRIKLQDQPFQILEMLIERPGTIITREELQKKVWPHGTFVDFDLSLNSAVKKIRQALNDDSDSPRYIETLYRRGYRFIAPVNGAADSGELQLVDSAPASPAILPCKIQGESKISQRKNLVFYAAIVLVSLLLALLAAIGGYRLKPPLQPTVLGYTQITHDGLWKGPIVTDGERLYFQELHGERFAISQVSIAGGETSVLQTPFQNSSVADVARNGTALLLGNFVGTGKGLELWSLPLPSGAPRRLGDYVTNSSAWSPDGSLLAYSRGADVYLTKSDGSGSQKIASVEGGQVFGLRFSPDNSRLRFEIEDPRNGSNALWEVRRDGSGLHPLLPGWNAEPRECCGNWTPDGKYFLFQSFRNGRCGLWALAEKGRWLGGRPEPVQLTNGPLDFAFPVASTDGKRIFAVGAQPRTELVKYDGKSGFTSLLGDISASDAAFSADGQWAAYVSIPQRQLWRSRVAGSERAELTFAPMEAALPRWSPDGKQIAFMGHTPNTGWRAYVIGSDGNGLRELIPGAEAGYDPGWSPDGKSVVLTLNASGAGGILPEGPGIAIVEIDSGNISLLPGGKQFFSPRWSPDGRFIAAITNDSMKLMLFDRSSQQWRELAKMPIGYPSWSHDGQYIYFDTTFVEDASFFRMRISDGRLERLFSLKGMRQFWGDFGSWTGLAPDDSPMLNRDISSQEIYAIDWQAP